LIVSGSSNGTVEGDIIKSLVVGPPSGFVVTSPTVFNPGDRDVAIPTQVQPTNCGTAPTVILGVVEGASTATTVIQSDLSAVASTIQGPRLFNLGQRPKVLAYAIRNGKLTVCDYTTNDCAAVCTVADGPTGTTANGSCNASWLPIASDVVSLRAQYGRDTTEGNLADPTKIMDGVVDVWDRTVPAPATAGEANVNACALLRVSAIRLVLVARSNQPEKAPGGVHVTATAPVWSGSDTTTLTSISAAEANAVVINLTATRPDTTTWPTWQDFRYKVFETTVPMRNITSLGAVDGC
jgi:type IV pilus assembly protein PilW